MKDASPNSSQLKEELKHENYRENYQHIFTDTLARLAIIAASAVLIAMLWMPVLEIYGSSMQPVLQQGDIVVCLKTERIKRGDLIAFYFGNKLLVKRCVALPGEVINMDEEGTVFINGAELSEPYLDEKALGHNEIDYPYIVPQESYFLLGDNRVTSEDSRTEAIGSVGQDQLVGKVLFCVWPLKRFGKIGD